MVTQILFDERNTSFPIIIRLIVHVAGRVNETSCIESDWDAFIVTPATIRGVVKAQYGGAFFIDPL